MKFEENWPRGEVDERCGQMDGQRTMDDDGQQVITIAHPKPCSDELKPNKRTMMVLYCSPEQTDLQITIEASAHFAALRFLYKFYVQE